MTDITFGKRRKQRRWPILPIISGICLLLAVGLFTIELVNFSQQEDRLPSDVVVAGIPVGGMQPAEAMARWEEAYAAPVVLYYNESPILLDPAAIGFRTNRETMIAQALAAGDSGSGFWVRFINHMLGQGQTIAHNIPLSADYQRGLLEQFLQDISARYDKPPGRPGYDLTTLTTYPGNPGFELDIDRAMDMIDAALRDPVNRAVVLPMQNAEAHRPSLETLRELIITYLDSQGFIYDGQTTVASVYIMDLITGEELNILGDVAFSAASTIKVAILVDYFRHLDFSPTREEAWLMANSLLCSNNSSSNLIMQSIGGGPQQIFAGIASVTNTAQYIGARNTFITAPFDLGIEGQQLGSIPAPQTSPNPNFNTEPDPFNQTTAEDMGTIFNMIYDCANYSSGLMVAFPNGSFNQTECRQMLELMSGNNLERLLQAGLPPGTRISHKNGWLGGTVGDAGIVFPPNGHDYVIAVYLWEDVEFQDFTRLWPLVEEISRAAWNYFVPENPLLQRRTDIPPTAQECEGNYLPPFELLDLNDIDGWKSQ
ncbi:MAG: hypothetical protein D6712_02310 [Chloroflexi bacterium]|nr:MAG: hypothetical protein D6712_02310 [Chloroflexota bacterium]